MLETLALVLFIAAMLLIVRPLARLLADNDWFRRAPDAENAEPADEPEETSASYWPRFVSDDELSLPPDQKGSRRTASRIHSRSRSK